MASTTQRTPLEASLRNAARWSLYLAFTLLIVTGGALYALLHDQFTIQVNPWYDVEFLDYRSVRDLQKLVRIDTTHLTGSEMDAALWLKDQLDTYGIEAEIEDMGDGKANLHAFIEGETDEFVVLHNHLDTDPIGDPDLWDFDPWSANIDVVWMYARGSFDMKSTVIAQLHTMQGLKEQIDRTGIKPRRGLMLLSTSSEETGSHEGAQHIVANRPGLLDGAWALFSEGGVVEAIDANVVKYLGVSFGQKRFIDVWYSADTIEPLINLRKRINGQPLTGALRLTPPVREFLSTYGPTRQLPDAIKVLTNPDQGLKDQAAFNALPDFYKSLFRDEVHVLPPEAHLPGEGFRMRTVIHLLEGSDAIEPLDTLTNLVNDEPEITVWVDPSVGSESSSPLDHPAYRSLIEQLQMELTGGVAGPYYLARFANDAQFFRKLEIPCYGFQPFLGLAADSYTVGSYNERIALPTFIEGVERYQAILWNLIEAPGDP